MVNSIEINNTFCFFGHIFLTESIIMIKKWFTVPIVFTNEKKCPPRIHVVPYPPPYFPPQPILSFHRNEKWPARVENELKVQFIAQNAFVNQCQSANFQHSITIRHCTLQIRKKCAILIINFSKNVAKPPFQYLGYCFFSIP